MADDRPQGKRGNGLVDNNGFGDGWGGHAKMVWPMGSMSSHGKATGYDTQSVDAGRMSSVFREGADGVGLGNGCGVGGRWYDEC